MKFKINKKASGVLLAATILILTFQNCSSDLRPADLKASQSSNDIPGSTPVASLKTCSLQTLTAQNGESITAYRSATAPFGSVCQSSLRACSNGTLGGDPAFQFTSCAVALPRNCSFNSAVVAHGTSVPGYLAPTGSCGSSPRSCVDGTLQGDTSYQYNTCNSSPPVSTCRPVLKEVRTLASDRSLNCSSRTTIWDETFSGTGRVVTKVTLVLAGSGNGGVHGWSAQFDKFGDGSRQAFGSGEDLCHNEALTKKFMGLGRFQAGYSSVAVSVGQYRSGDCVDGTITIKAGSTMEVWIEDPSSACVGKDIAYASHFGNLVAATGTAAGGARSLDFNFMPIVSTALTIPAAANLRVIAQNEVSPNSTSNTCGNRVQYASGAISLNGSFVDTQNVGYPASEGMTHALIVNEYFGTRSAGTYTAVTSAAVNQSAQLGALCGTNISGDSAIAIIVER